MKISIFFLSKKASFSYNNINKAKNSFLESMFPDGNENKKK